MKSDSKDKEESESTGAETQAETVKHSCYSASKGTLKNLTCCQLFYMMFDLLEVFRCFFLSDSNLSSEQKQDEKDKECPASMAKTFVVQEMYEAKMVSLDSLYFKPTILRSEFFSVCVCV